MRLINVDTLQFEEFQGEKIPKYAILSHTWGDDEVMFEDFHSPSARGMAGYEKIVSTCRLAKQHSLGYAWVDTCAIDKRSSAELSEAINSMFEWYRNSSVCFAYLVDVDVDWKAPNFNHSFTQSRWHTRGWTLQELLAPRDVLFYNSSWKFLGTKRELEDMIFNATRINRNVIQNTRNMYEKSVACRMSWASRRQTTRIEDQAYCLLGMFRVHMPLLYGERQNAFIRLQQEIMKISDDRTLFAWSFDGPEITRNKVEEYLQSEEIYLDSPLANSPQLFETMDTYPPLYQLGAGPYEMTNHGLQITLPLFKFKDPEGIWALGILGLWGHYCMGILLRKVKPQAETYVRVKVWNEEFVSTIAAPNMYCALARSQSIYIGDPDIIGGMKSFQTTCVIKIDVEESFGYEVAAILSTTPFPQASHELIWLSRGIVLELETIPSNKLLFILRNSVTRLIQIITMTGVWPGCSFKMEQLTIGSLEADDDEKIISYIRETHSQRGQKLIFNISRPQGPQTVPVSLEQMPGADDPPPLFQTTTHHLDGTVALTSTGWTSYDISTHLIRVASAI